MNKNYEEEYSVLEIAKYNLKHWPILAICAIIFGMLAGAYGYKNTKPSVVHYEDLNQTNIAFFIGEYNDTSITERMYDVEQVAISHGAYEKFIENTGYVMTYDEYMNMFGYSNDVVTSVLNVYIVYPRAYGSVNVETEEQANTLMQQLIDTQMEMYQEYLGEDAVKVLGTPYATSYTRAVADMVTTPKDLFAATMRGLLAGVFLGALVGIIVVSVIYLIGTVAKQAGEIEQKLKAPVLAFVHKNDRAEELKKATLVLQRDMTEHQSVCYIPFHEKNADGAYDLAAAFAKMNQKTLYINLSVAADTNGTSVSEYFFGKCSREDVEITKTTEGVDVVNRDIKIEEGKELLSTREVNEYIAEAKTKYERVIVNAPDIMISSDAYGIAAYCDKVVFGCKRREVTGTDLYEINHALENNELTLDGVVIYGN